MLAAPPKSNGICAPPQCCVWTSGLCHGVLSVMEDASPVALTVAGMDADVRRAALADIDHAIGQLGTLITAAKSMHG